MKQEVNNPEKLTEKFITDMLEETGCSVQFLNEAKPIILKLFRDTTGPALDDCLGSIKETIANQAKIENFRAASRLHPAFAGDPAISGVAV